MLPIETRCFPRWLALASSPAAVSRGVLVPFSSFLLFLALFVALPGCSREPAAPSGEPAASSGEPAASSGEPAAAPVEPAVGGDALRIVSINPSLTSILIALGAVELLVGVDDSSAAQQPSIAHLPRVGGLFSPSLEGVAALAPDVVLLVPSVEQRDFRDRLTQLGIEVVVFDNIRFEDVLRNISELGVLVGRTREAEERVRAIRESRSAAEHLAAGRPLQRTVIVLQRDPVFVVGRGGFIDELLTSAGGENLGAQLDEEYPQVAIEWVVAEQPEVLIDVTSEPGDPHDYWSRWPAIPAVAERRVLKLDPKTVTLPGPYLDRSIAALVTALHGVPAGASVFAHADPEADDS